MEYLKIFKDSAETQYASGVTPLMAFAALNEAIEFSPITPSQTRTGNAGNAQYAIQRMKRVKAKDAPAANASGAGSTLVDLYNTAQKVEWDTIDTMTGKKRSLLIDTEKFDHADILEDASAFDRTIANKTKNLIIEGEELASQKVFDGASNAATAVVLTTASTPQVVADEIYGLASSIQLLVDDYKAYSDKVICVIHPLLAKKLGELEGQGYQQGTNTFPNGVGNSFTYEGIEFYVSPILNAIESTTNAGNVAGAIVLDTEAYANAGLEKSLVTFADTLADKTIFGHTYNELDAVVDADRIKVVEFTPIIKSKKVND